MLGRASAPCSVSMLPSMARGVRAAAAQPSSHGRSRRRPAARVHIVAAANSSLSQAASKTACPALPNLLAAASLARWAPRAMRLLVVAVLIGAFFAVLDGATKEAFEKKCENKEPAAVVAELGSELYYLKLHLRVYFAGILVAYLACYVLAFGVAGAGPVFAEAHVNTSAQMLIGSLGIPDGFRAIWLSFMMRHGAPSSGGQQPSMP